MNDTARRIVEEKMRRGDRRGRDYSDYPDRRGDYRGRDRYGDDRRGRDYGEDYRRDFDDRRGDYRERDRYGDDLRGRDYGGDYGEGEKMKLSKSDINRWKKMLKNGDGTSGEHFSAEQIREAIKQSGIKLEEYDEIELCMTANMLYSDLGEALRAIVPREREPMIYVKLAKCWLDDKDAPDGSEKLALYFYCIVDDE